jgi:hypothetical protein
MSKFRLRRPTPALVISVVALVFALTGTGVAARTLLPRNSVGTAQLRANAVTSSKVRNHSLLARDFRPGQLPRGPQGVPGPSGPAGPAGPAGAAGPAGPSGVANITVHESDAAMTPGSRAFAIAACPSGQKATGGGVYQGDSSIDNNDHVIRSGPVNSTGGTSFTLVANGQVANAWYGEGYNAGTNGATLRVYVICAG